MDEKETTKMCENCRREISVDNHTIHTLHCSRNLRLCPVCKEPVPVTELTEHHDALHKPLPCSQCGEMVCGTDLEDHVRDSCGHTVKSCRYCDLELPRRDLPAHEQYCGTRTEQCAECREWVMHKYRAIHLQSNHGFLRLDDDPIPQPRNPLPPVYTPRPTYIRRINTPSTANPPDGSITTVTGLTSAQGNPMTVVRMFLPHPQTSRCNDANQDNVSSNIFNQNTPSTSSSSSTQIKDIMKRTYEDLTPDEPATNTATSVTTPYNATSANSTATTQDNAQNPNRPSTSLPPTNANGASTSSATSIVRNSRAANAGSQIPKRANDQPQTSTKVANTKSGKPTAGRSGTKKRPAPPPPSARDVAREAALCSALERFYEEQATRDRQNEYNRKHGLPPVLSAAAKLEKLRKMDALHNREEMDDGAWRNKLRGRVWMDQHVPNALIVGSGPLGGALPEHLVPERRAPPLRPIAPPPAPATSTADARTDFKDLKPMSSSEFAKRFSQLALAGASANLDGAFGASTGTGTTASTSSTTASNSTTAANKTDRFNEIKSSLHALRRGLNEVTAPFVSNPPPSPSRSPNGHRSPRADDEVRLPCEFCGQPQPAEDLVQHQGVAVESEVVLPLTIVTIVVTGACLLAGSTGPTTTGCRPDLARLSGPPPPPPRAASPPAPLIPCEFCAQLLPIYLVSAHQEQCRNGDGDDEDETDSD